MFTSNSISKLHQIQKRCNQKRFQEVSIKITTNSISKLHQILYQNYIKLKKDVIKKEDHSENRPTPLKNGPKAQF